MRKCYLKMTTSFPLLLLSAVFMLGLVSGCQEAPQQKQKELLIYCGITMIKPMAEIAKIIEQNHGCKIIISKGGSGNLLKAIKANMIGDLYLPGSDSYIKTCKEEGLVEETVHVGYNKAAMMTKKGNPKNIPATLDSMIDPQYYVVVGNPESGSIGRETKTILQKKKILEQTLANVKLMTTDSKDLVRLLKNDKADLVINWYATATWPENRNEVTALPISEQYAQRKKLVIGLLKTSRYPNIARAFMSYAAQKEGKDIFDKYGLYNVQ